MRIALVVLLICASAWLAVNVVLAGVIAQGVFAHAPPHPDHDFSKSVAGAVFGDLLDRWVAIVDLSLLPMLLVLLGAAVGYALRAHHRLTAALTLIVLLGVLGVHIASRATIVEARALRPPTKEADEARYTDEQHERFNELHHRSVMLFGTETALLLAAVVGVGIALAGRGGGLGTSAPAPMG